MSNSNSIKNFIIMWTSCMSFLVLATAYVCDYSWLIRIVPLSTVFLFIKRNSYSIEILKKPEKKDEIYYISAAAAMLPLIVYFCKRGENVTILTFFADRINMSYNVIAAVISSVLALIAYPFVLCAIMYICKYIFGFGSLNIKQLKFLIKPMLIVCAIACFSIITIIRSGFVYKDDMQRIVNGNTIYGREGRFFAEYIMCLFEMDTFFADVSPIPQLAGMVIMGISAVLIWHFLTEKKKAGFFDITAMLCFALCPYFLENVSFKYDSPQHALAILFSVIPLYCHRRLISEDEELVPRDYSMPWQYKYGLYDSKRYFAAVFICAVIMCTFHQVPMGLLPSLVITKVFIDWNSDEKSGKEIYEDIREAFVPYISGLLFYRVFLMRNIEREDLNAVVKDATEILGIKELVPGIIRNYTAFFKRVINDFEPLWTVLFIIMCAAFFILCVKASKKKKIYALAGTFVTFALLTVLSFGSYPLLKYPLYEPRHLYSICFLIGIICIITVCVYGTDRIIAKAVSAAMAVCFFMFSIKYGNALFYQDQYTRTREEFVVNDIANLDAVDKYDELNVKIIGTTGYCPEVKNMDSNMINRLVQTMFDEYFGTWYATGLYNQFGLRIKLPEDASKLKKEDMECVADNYYHSIYVKDDNVIIELKERSDCLWVE